MVFNSFEALFVFGGIMCLVGAVLALIMIRNDYDKSVSVDDPNEFIDPASVNEPSSSIDIM